MRRCCSADFILGEGGQKVLEQYEYGNPTKDYGFKRWYPEQGLTRSKSTSSKKDGAATLRDLTKRSF